MAVQTPKRHNPITYSMAIRSALWGIVLYIVIMLAVYFAFSSIPQAIREGFFSSIFDFIDAVIYNIGPLLATIVGALYFNRRLVKLQVQNRRKILMVSGVSTLFIYNIFGSYLTYGIKPIADSLLTGQANVMAPSLSSLLPFFLSFVISFYIWASMLSRQQL